jgi:hypothetical protein
MRQALARRFDGRGSRGRAIALAVVAGSAMAVGAPASASANAALKEAFVPFADCPVASVVTCLVSNTTGGEFVLGHKAVAIEKTVTMQGGLAEAQLMGQPLVAAADGNTLSRTPLTVPGGLVGIAGLGGEVTATAELAGPVTIDRWALINRQGTAVTLPIKVKLGNEVLGEECYIGSDAEPIVLHLTSGTTAPPSSTEAISGSLSLPQGEEKGKIVAVEHATLVDNDFSVPGATGCGGALSGVVDLVVDADVGIPASPGQSKAVMSGSLLETSSTYAAKYRPKEKKTKKARGT